MNSPKISLGLKVSIFFVLISAALLIAKNSQACQVYNFVAGSCGSNPVSCAFTQAGTGDTDSVCGIILNPPLPSTAYCPSWNWVGNNQQPSCFNSDIMLRKGACYNTLDTPDYNGKPCFLADEATDPHSGVHCSQEEGYTKYGFWDSKEQQCVTCNGPQQWLKLADTGQTCWDFTAIGNWFSWTYGWTRDQPVACSTIPSGQTCESACPGASPECDEKPFALDQPVAGGKCNNCVFTGPPTCGNDTVDPGEQCDIGPDLVPGTADDIATGCPSGECQADCTCGAPSASCEPTCSCTCPTSCHCSPCPDPTGEKCKGGFVPCGRNYDDPCTVECECCPCTLCHLFVMIKRLIDFVTLKIIFPLATLIMVIAGIAFVISGGSPTRASTAKKILTSIVIGVIIVLVSWLIIDTIIMFLTGASSPWSTIDCYVP